ncbi:hypothetical protein [Haloarcula sp. JP-L23]|uniref:hypothetical protein n=1 Tax=Haloarcula sp. JP-L23 TaxID=2716717 RepID=UPI00140F49BA|nr:hypothetical protein G9465_18040 [Haloarcula sp. JP-L23]
MGIGSFRDIIGNALYGTDAIRRAYHWYKRAWATATVRYPIGANIFTRDWDLLIVLDTCRVDALRAVADEYDFLDDIGVITSVGSCSPEWIANTFQTAYTDTISRTACISDNAYMSRILEDRTYLGGTARTVTASDLHSLDQPWQYVPDEQKPFVHTPPQYATNKAINVGRTTDADRILVHYLPPHSPYTANAIAESRELEAHEETPFQALRDGIPFNRVWAAYLDELRLVLDHVSLLLDNITAEKVVITADHGEAFGEYGIYSHPLGMPHPHIKRVPWATTTAVDTGTHEPELTFYQSEETAGSDPANQLAALGYLK